MNERMYKDIIDSLPYAFLIVDEELKVLHCNRSCEVLFSKAKAEILGRDLFEVIPHKELRNRAREVLRDSGTKLVELHLDDQKPRILRAILTALDVSGHCLITLEDISERARLEDQLVQSEKLAGMGLLAASIAHELGNPLSIMSSTLQYIRDSLLSTSSRRLKGDPRVRGDQTTNLIEAIETIMDSVKQMHELLLTLSGFTGSQRPRFEPMDLRKVLSQMLAFIHKETEVRKIKVYHQFDNNIPNCQVDPREIKQLFLNLLKNAIEAMPDGGNLHVRLYLAGSKDSVCVDISDTGCGMGETELRSIFRPFYSTKPDGTGLGLSFCRRVAEEHGGGIKVKSELGRGSTFSVILPVKQGGGL